MYSPRLLAIYKRNVRINSSAKSEPGNLFTTAAKTIQSTNEMKRAYSQPHLSTETQRAA